MISDILSVLYFFLPAIAANMAPVFVRRVPILDVPLDFGSTLRGKQLFGENKTWRGLLFGVLIATLVFHLQQWLFFTDFFAYYSLIDYPVFSVFVGSLLGFGALVGDALESVAKRQLGILPGKSLFFWDQLDFLFGMLLVSIPYWIGVWPAVIISLCIVLVLNVGVQKLGYRLGFKNDPL